jgi:hypothetical protein
MIIAVAIVYIVVAVLSSAQRADKAVMQNETQSFSHTLSNFGERLCAKSAVSPVRIRRCKIFAFNLIRVVRSRRNTRSHGELTSIPSPLVPEKAVTQHS